MTIPATDVIFSPAGTGAVDRTVQDKLLDFINVKDYGAAGDGVTDDTDAFKDAIAFAVVMTRRRLALLLSRSGAAIAVVLFAAITVAVWLLVPLGPALIGLTAPLAVMATLRFGVIGAGPLCCGLASSLSDYIWPGWGACPLETWTCRTNCSVCSSAWRPCP